MSSTNQTASSAGSSTTSSPTRTAQPKRRRLGKGLSGLIGEPVAVATNNKSRDDSKIEAVTESATSRSADPIHDSGRAAAISMVSHPTDETHPDNNTSIPVDIEISNAMKHGHRDLVVHLPLHSVVPNRFQPRSDFEQEGLAELAASIRSEGVMQPVLVRPASDGGSTGGRYELIAGERRWRAAKLAGLETVPAIVRELSAASSAEWALIENVHRQDLNAMERAEAMAALLSRFGMSQTALAEKLGLERPTVANLVRLVELEPAIRDLIAAGKLGAGHGKALLAIPESPARVSLAESAAAGGWSVRRLEQEVRTARESSASPNKNRSLLSQRQAVHGAMERRLSDHLGTKVRIATSGAGSKGKIEIAFFDLDHFDGLMRSLGIGDAGAESGGVGPT